MSKLLESINTEMKLLKKRMGFLEQELEEHPETRERKDTKDRQLLDLVIQLFPDFSSHILTYPIRSISYEEDSDIYDRGDVDVYISSKIVNYSVASPVTSVTSVSPGPGTGEVICKVVLKIQSNGYTSITANFADQKEFLDDESKCNIAEEYTTMMRKTPGKEYGETHWPIMKTLFDKYSIPEECYFAYLLYLAELKVGILGDD